MGEQDGTGYVVFGAGGATGLQVVETLVKLGHKVKAVVRKPEEHSEITYVAKKLDDEPSGNAELKVVKGDVTDYDSCIEALKLAGKQPLALPPTTPGVRACVVRAPIHPAQGAKGAFFTASGKGYLSAASVDHRGVENVARAAKAQGVERVVLISSAFTSPHRYLNPIRIILNSIRFRLMDAKFKGEESLRRSGVPYTVIRPGRLTDGRDAPWEVLQGDNGAGGAGVARADVGRLAVMAMLSTDAANTTFEVFGAPKGRSIEPADALKVLLKDRRQEDPAADAARATSSGGAAASDAASAGADATLPEERGVLAKVWRTLVMLP